jgi:hypothetical protein
MMGVMDLLVGQRPWRLVGLRSRSGVRTMQICNLPLFAHQITSCLILDTKSAPCDKATGAASRGVSSLQPSSKWRG